MEEAVCDSAFLVQGCWAASWGRSSRAGHEVALSYARRTVKLQRLAREGSRGAGTPLPPARPAGGALIQDEKPKGGSSR
jgi:hypothetical protein